jgi:hypothetical protein
VGTSKTRDLPPGLEGVRRRFEHWRRTHRRRSRIPEALWAAAVRAAGRCGIHRTSKALRLDYYSLKDRVEEQSRAVPDRADGTAADQRRPYKPTTAARKRLPQRCQARSVPTFLELAPGHFPGVPLGHCECTLELEDADGAKMRVHLKAADTPDLAALSRSFWNPGP